MIFQSELKKSHNIPALKAKGCQVNDNQITFEGKESDFINILAECDRGLAIKSVNKAPKKAVTESDRAQLGAKLGTDVSEYGIYECIACDTKKDFAGDKFTKRFLEKLIPQVDAGISILVNHNANNVIGQTISAKVEAIPNDLENYQLVIKFYVPDFSVMPNGTNSVKAIDSGIWKFTSVSIRAFDVSHEDSGDEWVTVFDAREGYPDPVFIEHSVVYRGAQPRAEIVKDISTLPSAVSGYAVKSIEGVKVKQVKKESVKMEKTIKVNGQEITLNIEEKNASNVDVIQKALDDKNGHIERLEKSLKGMKEGRVVSIQNLQKKLGLPTDAESYLYKLEGADLDSRVDALKAMDAKVNPKNQLKEVAGGDPVKEDENIELNY